MKTLFGFALAITLVGCASQDLAQVDPNYTPPPGGGGTTPGGTGGSPTTGPDPAFSGPSVCTSKQEWTRGDRGSSLMHPGMACIDCHSSGGGPDLTIGGTVFPTGHEPDDCNGSNGSLTDVQVIVTDGTGKSVTLTVNSAGNFYSQARLTPPFSAKVVKGSLTRAMMAQQTTGDCNSCHTEQGDQSAPGRIAEPQ
jgi:hypothetical protein